MITMHSTQHMNSNCGNLCCKCRKIIAISGKIYIAMISKYQINYRNYFLKYNTNLLQHAGKPVNVSYHK